MRTPTAGPDRARVVASGLVALVLLLLVAALARDAGDAGAVATSDVALPSLAALLPVLAAIGATITGAAAFGALIGGKVHRDLNRSLTRPLLLALGLVVLVWLVTQLPRRDRPEAVEEVEEEAPAAEVVPEGPDWLPSGPLLLVVVLGTAAGGVLVARLLQPTDDAGEEAADDAAGEGDQRLVAGLDEVIEELRREPDPRRAVIAAWARLEALLADHRLRRRASEAPTRYVGRILGRLTTSGAAVEALTTTFERAMFSPHAIGRDDQLAAIDALLAVRDDLEATG